MGTLGGRVKSVTVLHRRHKGQFVAEWASPTMLVASYPGKCCALASDAMLDPGSLAVENREEILPQSLAAPVSGTFHRGQNYTHSQNRGVGSIHDVATTGLFIIQLHVVTYVASYTLATRCGKAEQMQFSRGR